MFLSDCYHIKVGVHDCNVTEEAAGVICNGMQASNF